MAWITPILDWDGVTVGSGITWETLSLAWEDIAIPWELMSSLSGRKYYNYYDLDRVENNAQFVYDLLISFGYVFDIEPVVTGRNKQVIVYFGDLNRVERTIKKLSDESYVPAGWIDPKTDWETLNIFSYIDANRLETNLYLLKTLLENIQLSFIHCGNITSGQEFNLGGY